MTTAVLMLLAAALVAMGTSTAGASTTSPTPSVQVLPSTGLAKGSVVVVSASGLPYRYLDVIQCDYFTPNADTETEPGNWVPTRTTSADGSGHVRVSGTLMDPVSYDVPAGDDEPVYCRADHCRIFLAWTDGIRTTQWVKVAGTAFGAEGHTLKIREQS